MKSKLNKHRGFTIAEIIVAVAIMATLIAVLMKGLQTSRANIKRDTYQVELNKRAMTIGAKAEAHVFKEGTVAAFAAGADDKKDPVGGIYTTALAAPSKPGEKYKFTLTPASKGELERLGVKAYTYEFE